MTETYGYDTRDRLISKTMPGGALAYTYDANSSRLTMTSMVGGTTTVATYAYDDAGRLDTVTDTLGRVYDLSYDAVGNRTGLAYPNGAATTYTYNALNRFTNLSTLRAGTPIQSYSFTLGPTGNRTQIAELDKTKVYTYDDLYRLTGEQVIGGTAYSKTFAYDPVGNRQAQTTAGSAGSVVVPGTVNYRYDSRDRLLAENGTVYGYDANGNVVTKSGEATYTWDTENRLVRIAKVDGTAIEHAYDADGVRIRTRTTPAAGAPHITNFLVDTSGGLSHVVAECGPALLQTAYYLRALDDLLAVIRTTGTRYYHADGIGSVRRLTDESGAVTDSYEYTAFGEQYEHVGADPQPYAFAGEPLDPNSGFQYHRARWMQPDIGGFAGMDPWEGELFEPASLHRYIYGHLDPLWNVDPSGEESLPASLTAVVGSVTVALGNCGAQIQAAFARGGPALGNLWPRLGTWGNLVTRRVLIEFQRLKPPFEFQPEQWINGRRLDFFIKLGREIAYLETKLGLPWRKGPALERLAGQMEAGLASGARTVLFAIREPTATQVRLLERRLGPMYDQIERVYGVEALWNWLIQFGKG